MNTSITHNLVVIFLQLIVKHANLVQELPLYNYEIKVLLYNSVQRFFASMSNKNKFKEKNMTLPLLTFTASKASDLLSLYISIQNKHVA